MAGYRRQNTIYNLTFPEFEGLEVIVRGLSTGQMMQLWKAGGNAKSKSKDDAANGTEEMLKYFANALVGWNLEGEQADGTWEKVPATLDGIKSQDLPFVLRIVEAWTDVMAGTEEDLGKDSSSGEKSLAESLPMAPV
jgi:hypothetical protein